MVLEVVRALFEAKGTGPVACANSSALDALGTCCSYLFTRQKVEGEQIT